jgi:signal-transduction protein with cAMP-binding, CBS, and nucleotidyltransferase domain
MPESQGDELSTTLGTLLVGPLTLVSESDSLATVAQVFRDRGTSCAVLAEAPLRVVTERDLAGAWAQGRSAEDEIALISTINPCWASVTSSLAEAAALMVNLGIRHLVVLDTDGRPTGVVSMAELFTVLVHSQEPVALYASFASFMMRGANILSGKVFAERTPDGDSGSHLLGSHE